MINVYANFKYVDANDDSCPHDLEWISDELTITFEDEKVNPFLLGKLEHIIYVEGFHPDNILTYSLCYSNNEWDTVEQVTEEGFRTKLRYIEIAAAQHDIHIVWDKVTRDFIEGAPVYIEIVNTHCEWVKDLESVYNGKYTYNPKCLKYDPTKREL